MTHLRLRIKPYIQPFERTLALAELSALAGVPLNGDSASGELTVVTKRPHAELVSRLAYWEAITVADRLLYTHQVLREATVNIVRNGITTDQIRTLLPFKGNISLPNRRCLRYGTHGLHEYRGKFFPQLVRALINIAGIKEHGTILDPMIGSGTTAVEASLMGCRVMGLDMNPLSVLMARTKVELLRVSPTRVEQTYFKLSDRLQASKSRSCTRLAYFSSLPRRDQEYLKQWFAPQALADLDQVALAIKNLEPGPIQDLMRLCLSNILRKVSWQKEDDLRVRKEVRNDDNTDSIQDFLDEVSRTVKVLLAFLYQQNGSATHLGSFDIREGDARKTDEIWRSLAGSVDAIITSPPYATALPYLDTDRLSLCYLGLLSRPEHRQRDHAMIGNREVTERLRQSYLEEFLKNKDMLPNSVVRLIERVERLNSRANVGFRRRNLPALLAKYFFDMRAVLRSASKLLKSGAPAYIVVGNNHTIAGGKRVEIGTAALLSEIAEGVGLQADQHVNMDMLVSRDIFKKNAVASEIILCLRK